MSPQPTSRHSLPPLLLSRYKLAAFLACQRGFELRYLRRLTWPAVPRPEEDEARAALGRQFHQLLQRHFMGLPVETAAIGDARLRRWWDLFAQNQPDLPNGRILTEATLTIPIEQQFLHGRFDLLVIGEEEGRPFAHVFDWKTGKAQDETALRRDWQTRLYLALLAEGGGALWGEGAPSGLNPDDIRITYWYVTEPDSPRTLQYSQTEHRQNWQELTAVVSQIQTHLESGEWPLTDDLVQCRWCSYQIYCGRGEGDTAVTNPDESEEEPLFPDVEPALP